jgi:AbrB family looped-hinge helix DNA binding protein
MDRPLDYEGRVVIPSEIRHNLQIEPEDRLDIKQVGRIVVLTPVKQICIICSQPGILISHGICSECWDMIKQEMLEGDEDEPERE